MLGMQKRLVKTVAGTLSAVMISTTVLPLAAYAAPPPPPPPPPGHHDMHHDHGGKMNVTAALVCLALTVGIMAWTNNHYKHKIPSDPTSYAAYRKGFTDSLDARELSFYNDMYNHPTGEYKTVYTNRETLKTIKKLCKKLPQDFKYTGTTSVKEADGRAKKYIFFQRLKPIAFSPTINTVTDSIFVEAL